MEMEKVEVLVVALEGDMVVVLVLEVAKVAAMEEL